MLSRNLGDKSRCAPLPYEFQCWSATTQCWQPRVRWCLPCSMSKGTGGFLFQRRKRRALPPTSLVLPRWSWQPHAWHSLVWNQSWFSEQHQGCVTSTSLQCCCTQFLQDLIHLLWVSFTTTVCAEDTVNQLQLYFWQENVWFSVSLNKINWPLSELMTLYRSRPFKHSDSHKQ